ncbi:MAG: lipid II flippase MurJ [Myxococcota bacterium]
MNRIRADGRGVASAAGLLAASVLLARVFGLLRDILFARNVGAGTAADAYFAAFLIPDILGYLLASGAASVALTPPYLKRLEREGAEAAARFAAVVVGNVTAASVVATLLCWVWADPLLRLQFPDFDPVTHAAALRLTRIVLPAQVFFLTGGCLRAVLMAHGHFGAQAASSVVYSAAPIAGGLVLAGADGFAWGTLAGALIGQWAIPALALRRLPGAIGRTRIGLLDADFREYLWLALPLMLGVGLTTVDEWYEKWVGATVAPGVIAAITYARKLMMLPVGVIGQAVGAALLPTLTALFQREARAEFDGVLTSTLRTILGLGLLASGGLFALADPIVRVVYERGRFAAADAVEVAGLLAVLAWAVPGWVVQQVAVRGFYARSEMWRAMGLSTAIAVCVFPLYWVGGQLRGVAGLALASVAAISLNALVTLVWLKARSGAPDLRALLATLARTLAIVAAASLAALAAARALALRDPRAWLALLGGGLAYGLVALVGVRFVGDAPLREGVVRVALGLGRRLVRRRPA